MRCDNFHEKCCNDQFKQFWREILHLLRAIPMNESIKSYNLHMQKIYDSQLRMNWSKKKNLVKRYKWILCIGYCDCGFFAMFNHVQGFDLCPMHDRQRIDFGHRRRHRQLVDLFVNFVVGHRIHAHHLAHPENMIYWKWKKFS